MATCSSADSVLEAASLIKSNSTKLNTFVNGTSTQTVQLGTGDPTPTLRKFIADAQDVVTQAALDAGQTVLDDVAQNLQDIADLKSDKADKVPSATNGHLAGLNASGNLTDSGIVAADVQTKFSTFTENNIRTTNASGFAKDSGKAIANVQFKLSSATANNILKVDSNGFMQDSGIASSNVALKDTDIVALEEAVESLDERKADKFVPADVGNLAELDFAGNLRDAGRAVEDFVPLLAYANGEAVELAWQVRTSIVVHAVEAKADDLDVGKADKVSSAVSGNLAKLDSTGNLRDSGKDAEDFTPLLTYANGEAQKLALQNRMNVEIYNEWYVRGIARLNAANTDAMKAVQSIRDIMGAFDESVAQHRLQIRLFDGTNPTSSSRPVLFVISGQSNAVGSGAYTPFDRAVDCGWYWPWSRSEAELKPLVDPIGQTWVLGSGWCAFARRFFALTGRKVILLNIASGGSAVTDGGYTTTNTWADNGYGTLRSSRQTIWNAFSAAVPATDYDLGGILWDQGGTDGDRIYAGTITVQDFKDGTLDVWNWHRTLVGSATCPIFAALIDYNYSCLTNAGVKAARKAIMDATYDICINGGDSNVHLGFTIAPDYINAWDYYMSDNVHYNPHGYRVQGDSFARSAAHFLEM